MVETYSSSQIDDEVKNLSNGVSFATLNKNESKEMAKKAMDVASKVSSKYFRIFFNIYFDESISTERKIYNLSAVKKQLINNSSINIPRNDSEINGVFRMGKVSEIDLMKYFLSILKKRETLKVSIDYGRIVLENYTEEG